MQFYINKQCEQILNILLTQTGYISFEDISKLLGVSRRTVYYNVEKINDYFVQKQLTVLKTARGKGIMLAQDARDFLQKETKQDSSERVYVFSAEERAKMIICRIVYCESVYVEQIIKCLRMSRSTVYSSIKDAANILAEHGLTLDFHKKRGYFITGDFLRVISVFMLCISDLERHFGGDVLCFLDAQDVEQNLKKLECMQKEIDAHYIDGFLFSVAVMISLFKKHKNKILHPNLNQEQVQKTKEYACVANHFSYLYLEEQLYVAIYLLGGRRTDSMRQDFFDVDYHSHIVDVVSGFVSEFEKVACVQFDDRDKLESALVAHLSRSFFRYRYGIQEINPLLDDIKAKYPELFSITKFSSKYLEEHLDITLFDGDIAFMALHFGSFLKIPTENENLSILIVCMNGVATGNMLKREIQKLLPSLRIVGVASTEKIDDVLDECDLIVSTVKLEVKKPVVVVRPILTDVDKNAILKEVDAFHKLRTVCSGNFVDAGANVPVSILDDSRVQVFDGDISWQESIAVAAAPLVKNKSVETKYVDAIIKIIERHGMYMFITRDVILAHAKPQDGVNNMDVSLTVFKKPVKFSDSHFAKIAIVLAANNQEKHLGILHDLLNLLGTHERVERIASCLTSDEIISAIKDILSEPAQD